MPTLLADDQRADNHGRHMFMVGVRVGVTIGFLMGAAFDVFVRGLF